MSTRLRIGLFGGFSLTSDPPPEGLLSSRQQGLLACLVVRAARPIARQELAGLLWPESTDAQALTNLRRELHHLRRLVPDADDFLEAESRTITWRADPRVEIDVATFESAAAAGLSGQREALEVAARTYTGDLLPTCDDEWIGPERERLRRRAVEALGRLVDELERERAYGDAIEHAGRLVAMDPVNEAAWRALMRCHARRGQHAMALHAYQTCVSVLKREVGAQPSAATRLAYREVVESDESHAVVVQPAVDAASVHPLVGRAAEWAMLQTAWQQAAVGRAAFALVRGEAGIGKTRLVEELVDWCSTRGVSVAATRCYAGEGRLAYGPVGAWLLSDVLGAAFQTLDPVWQREAARVQPELLPAESPTPQLENWQRRRLFEGLARVVRAASPLLLVLDDIQWCDSDTIEWLLFLLNFDPRAPLLIACTERSENESDNDALRVFLRELKKTDRLHLVELGPLDDDASLRLVEVAGGSTLGASASTALARRSGGHPLFIIEAARIGAADADVLPPRVQAVVAARLDELSPAARSLAELAAVFGRDFTFDLLASAADLEEDALVAALDELWRRRVVRETSRDGWDFTHDRIREVTYALIGPARRRLLHRRVAQALELLFASDLDSVSVAVASQLEQAQQPTRAAEFFERAAHVAMRVFAPEEAIRCFRRALDVLARVPPSRDRDRIELRLQRTLCGPLASARGYTAHEVETTLQRTIDLARDLEDANAELDATWGLGATHLVRSSLVIGRDLADRATVLSKTRGTHRAGAHHLLGGIMASVGDLEGARLELEAIVAEYDPANPSISTFGSDFGVFARAWLGQVLCLQDKTAEALRSAADAIAAAERTGDPYNLALAQAYAAITHQFRGDTDAVRVAAERTIALCERHSFAYYGEWALALLGWVRLKEGRIEDARHLVRTGADSLKRQGSLLRRSYYLSLLAETYLAAGDLAGASAILDAALATAEAHGERWWLPEVHRLKGLASDPDSRRSHFEIARQMAREHGHRLLERRAVESLAGL